MTRIIPSGFHDREILFGDVFTYMIEVSNRTSDRKQIDVIGIDNYLLAESDHDYHSTGSGHCV